LEKIAVHSGKINIQGFFPPNFRFREKIPSVNLMILPKLRKKLKYFQKFLRNWNKIS